MRLAVLSARGVDDAVYWRNVRPPLEDELASQPGATLVVPPPFRRPTIRAVLPAWLAAIRTVRKADTLFWIQLHLRPAGPVWALGYIKPRARRASLVLDPFPIILGDLPRYYRLCRLAHCFVAQRIPALSLAQSQTHQSYEWLPYGFNDRVFRDHGLERDVYAFWMGRRYASLHEALLRHCSEHGLDYQYLDPPNKAIPLDELSRLSSRARYFVTVPPDIEDQIRAGGTSPLTGRYLEGAGARCRLLGVRPRSGEYELMLPDDALVECAPDGSDLASVLEKADADQDFEAKAAAAHQYVHREHTWERRAVYIYQRLLAIERGDGRSAKGRPISPARDTAPTGSGPNDTAAHSSWDVGLPG
jgi:Glycosyl transferases group 1